MNYGRWYNRLTAAERMWLAASPFRLTVGRAGVPAIFPTPSQRIAPLAADKPILKRAKRARHARKSR